MREGRQFDSLNLPSDSSGELLQLSPWISICFRIFNILADYGREVMSLPLSVAHVKPGN